jgi:hypothetical protein
MDHEVHRARLRRSEGREAIGAPTRDRSQRLAEGHDDCRAAAEEVRRAAYSVVDPGNVRLSSRALRLECQPRIDQPILAFDGPTFRLDVHGESPERLSSELESLLPRRRSRSGARRPGAGTRSRAACTRRRRPSGRTRSRPDRARERSMREAPRAACCPRHSGRTRRRQRDRR